MHNVISYDKLVEKWGPVLNEESAGTIQDKHRKAVTAAVLENQENALREEGMMFDRTQQHLLTALLVQLTGIQY